MSHSRQQDLASLIVSLKHDIDLACEHSLHDAASLLRIALLEVRLQLHEISDDELRAFTNHLQRQLPRRNKSLPRSGANVSMGLMQKLSRQKVGRKA
jgi:hypothetical protein